jgi:manganese transport protein
VALGLAFFVNAAILILAAQSFYGRSGLTAAGLRYAFNADTDWIRVAYFTLSPLLGTTAASTLFAVALLASGQSSTITGTLAGQVVMEGYVDFKLAPWKRRLATRLIAIIPAVAVVGLHGDGGVNELLVLSQVVLALQLPFALIPLLVLTGRKSLMGIWRNGWFLIVSLDLYSLPDAARQLAGVFGWR